MSRWPGMFSRNALEAWTVFSAFGALQAAMQLLVPGTTFRGPVSPMGNVPEYKVRLQSPIARSGSANLFRCNALPCNVKIHQDLCAGPWRGPPSLLCLGWNRPGEVQANGVQCFLLTGLLFYVGVTCVFCTLPLTHLVQ